MILASVIPLLQETVSSSMQKVSVGTAHNIQNALIEIHRLPGVTGYRNLHFWEMVSSNVVGSLHISASDDADEQLLLNQITEVLIRHVGTKELTVQIEKDKFISTLSPSERISYRFAGEAGNFDFLGTTDV
jgi:Co/Zn/Cd efflux system component